MFKREKNCRYSFMNRIDDAALTGIQPILPANNLKKVSRIEVYRASLASPYEILKGNFSALFDFNIFYLHRTNLTSNGTWRVELFSELGQTGIKTYDSNFFPAWNFQGQEDFLDWEGGARSKFSVKYLPSKVIARSFRISIKDIGNANGFIQVSKIWLGEYYSPSVNPDWGSGFSWSGNAITTRMPGGSLISDGDQHWRELSMNFGWIKKEDRQFYSDLFRIVKTSKEFFFSLHPEKWDHIEKENTALVKFMTMPNLINYGYDAWLGSNSNIHEI